MSQILRFFRSIALLVVMLGSAEVSKASNLATVKFEAESASLGSDWAVSNSSPAYITISTGLATNNPTDSTRVATFSVTFPSAGTYDLYAHVFVGTGGFNNDSLFLGNGFGTQDPTNSSDWILVNGLAGVGFNNSTDVVTGKGTLGSGVWKWIDLSKLTGQPGFVVPSGNLTQTMQIGGREAGLNIDSFVFGMSSFSYTVANLDAGVDGTPPAAGTSTINWTNVLQRIDGFGGGVVFLDVPDPVSSANMDTFFNTNNANQLGLTLLRVRIDPGTNWGTALADAQKAVARGARVMATPWSPPVSVKTTNSVVGGAVATNQYANYASYLNRFAGYMKSNGVQLAAISIQNEPDFLATYESCLWNSSQFLSFFRTNASAITNAPVMMPESFHSDQSLSDATLNDPVAVTNVDIIGGHLYGATIADYPNAHNKGKPTWMTEYLVNDQSIDSAIVTAQQIHDCLNLGNMSAYIWWKCIGNSNGLVNAAGVPQKRGFVMAQFSRFVRPGFNRIGDSYTGSILTTAYRNTNSTAFAIVTINPTDIALTPTFNLTNFPAVSSVTPWVTSPSASLAVQPAVGVTNGTFSYTMPALSVVTFAGQINNSPVLAPVADQTIDAGVTLAVTNTASDPNLPAQTLTFTLLNAPTNALLTTLGATNARVIWRPTLSQVDSTNVFAVTVSDNGNPSQSATNHFTVKVNPLNGQPSFASVVQGAGQMTLGIAGPTGPDYTLQFSTNLSDWQTLLTSNSPVTPFSLTVTNQNDPVRFYRIQIGP